MSDNRGVEVVKEATSEGSAWSDCRPQGLDVAEGDV